MNPSRKNAVTHAVVHVIESLEQRQLLSASLTLSSTMMVFNDVKNAAPANTQTLTLTDTGDATLVLGPESVSLVNDPSSPTMDAALFSILNSSSVPASLAPGQSFGLQIDYRANAIGINSALLDINSGDPVNPLQEVNLRGIGTKGLGGSNQPSLATILQAYKIPTYVGEGFDDANAATDSTYPQPPDASTQEAALQRMVKAGAGPVTIQVLASFTASGFAKSYVLGTYAPGNPSSLSELFYTPGSENQTTYVQPQGSTSFDPGTSQFGFYFVSNSQVKGRIGYSEDSLNTWDTTDPRKFRFFPLENPDGSVVANAYVMTSTEWNAPAGYDFTNIVAIVRNIKAAPGAPDGPVLGLQNLNALPGSNRMIFNKIQSPNSSIGDVVHDSGILQVNNTGDEPLIISSYSISTGWQLTSPPTFPVTIAAGASLQLTVTFIATAQPKIPYNETNSTNYPSGGAVYNGTLTINSNDPNNPTATQALAGWRQYHSENDNEPSLQSIVNLLAGWTTNINSTPIATLTESQSTNSTPVYYGEEVVSPYWMEADTSLAVSVQQIAAYHTEGDGTTTYWYPQGSTSYKTLFTTGTDDGQTLLPLATGTTTPAAASFTSTGAFGFRVNSPYEYSDDSLNTFKTGGGHHMRFFPVRDYNGNIVPNTYFMTMDYSNTPQNFDFQDNVYVITNIRPALSPAAPVDFYASGVAGNVSLQWAAVADTTLAGYNVYSGSSATGTFTLLTSTPITATSYIDSAPKVGTTTYYRITAVDASSSLQSLADSASVAIPATTIVTPPPVMGDPVGADQSINTMAGVAVTVDVVSMSTDTNGTLLPSSVRVSTLSDDGSTSVDTTTGIIKYTPDPGFSGSDSFQYTIADNTGAVSTPDTITIAVAAQPTGDPVAANLSTTTGAGNAVTVDVAPSATDDTSATILPSTVVVSQAPADGTTMVDPVSGKITYTPYIGFAGSDSFSYTIADNLQAVSAPALVTVTVTPSPTVPVAASVASSTTVNGTTAVNVATSATPGSSALVPGSVTVTTNPANGIATVDPTTGTITYTPAANFVGTDTLQYTIGDASGAVSAPATLSFNVSVAVDNTTVKSLIYTDANGNKVTLSITGGGTAQISFNGSGTTQLLKKTLVLTGSNLAISGITIAGASARSSLKITHRGTSVITLADVAIPSAFGSINAPFANLTGTLAVTGALKTLSIGSATGATITAQSIGSITVAGNFDAAVTVTGPSTAPFALSSVHVGGQLGDDIWNITGNTGTIVTGSVAAGWSSAFSATLNALTIRSSGFAGTLNAGAINTLNVAGNDSGVITAGSIRSMRVVGTMTGGSINLTNAVSPTATDLAHLVVTGATVNTQIISAGSIGSITTGGISGSVVEVGTVTGVTLPASNADFTESGAIKSFQVTGKTSTFSNTDIAAQMLGSMKLGNVQTANGGLAFGIGGGVIASVTATLDGAGVLRMNAADLSSSVAVSSYITAHSLTNNDLIIRPAI